MLGLLANPYVHCEHFNAFPEKAQAVQLDKNVEQFMHPLLVE